MKMKPILLSIKPVNKDSSNKLNLSNRANLVNSTGNEPIKDIEHVNKIKNLFFQKNLKNYCLLR